MITIAFFYFLCPGEYTALPSDTQPFDYQSIQLFLGPTCLDINLLTNAQLHCAIFTLLTFDRKSEIMVK